VPAVMVVTVRVALLAEAHATFVSVEAAMAFENTTVRWAWSTTVVAALRAGAAPVAKLNVELGVTSPTWSVMEKAVRVYVVLAVMVVTVRVALLAEAHATLVTGPLDKA
jgi:hypothetical protein